MSISNLSEISSDAIIGKGVVVESFTKIYDDVEIGEGTWIGSNVTIFPGTRIGKNCRIFPSASIGAIPQDLKFEGEKTILVIGDNTTIRECCTLNRGTSASGHTLIGKNCLLMAYVHIAHDCEVGNNVVLANSTNVAGHVTIGDHAILGGVTAVHQFVKIGQHVMIGGGSLVRKDVPPYVTAAREPLSYVGVNSIGLKRRGFTNEQIIEIQNLYRELLVKGGNIQKNLDALKNEIGTSRYLDEIAMFIEESDRGIIRAYQ